MEFREINKPSARTENLVVQELADEFLIYDLDTHKAYNLNETSSFVWQSCDGSKGIGEIAAALQKKVKQPVKEEIVWLALEGLKKEGLVSYEAETPAHLRGLNRREVVKRIGLASLVALPVVSSLIAPTAAHAQSQFAPVPEACRLDAVCQCEFNDNRLGNGADSCQNNIDICFQEGFNQQGQCRCIIDNVELTSNGGTCTQSGGNTITCTGRCGGNQNTNPI